MSERQPLPIAYIARVHAAAQRTCGSVLRRREWPNSEWSSPVIVMSLCAEIARLNIELQRANETVAALSPAHQNPVENKGGGQ